jgi:hypothetical protein
VHHVLTVNLSRAELCVDVDEENVLLQDFVHPVQSKFTKKDTY